VQACRVQAYVEELSEKLYKPMILLPFQPPNDSHGIQRDDLILSLRAVMASTPQFAEVGLGKVTVYSLCLENTLKKRQ
jgi:hypothetical protein